MSLLLDIDFAEEVFLWKVKLQDQLSQWEVGQKREDSKK